MGQEGRAEAAPVLTPEQQALLDTITARVKEGVQGFIGDPITPNTLGRLSHPIREALLEFMPAFKWSGQFAFEPGPEPYTVRPANAYTALFMIVMQVTGGLDAALDLQPGDLTYTVPGVGTFSVVPPDFGSVNFMSEKPIETIEVNLTV